MELLCDTITGGNSCKLMELQEPMEVYSPITAAFPTKRKAESDLADEIEESSGEIEESGDEIEESSDEIEQIGDEIEENSDGTDKSGDSYVDYINEYYKSKWIAPEWDVDSFNGLEFDESEEERLCVFDDDVDVDVDKWLRFRKQHIENKGFYVEPELWPMYKYSDYRVIYDLERSAGRGRTYRTYFKEMACLCLQRFNEDQKKTKENFMDVEFVEVVGGVVRPSGKPKSFITFKAKEKPDGPLVEYQAKVCSDFVDVMEDYPILCRPAPPKPSN